MSYEAIKHFLKSFGLYHGARWCDRHVINRRKLRQFRDEISFYSRLIRRGDLVFDVGANNGTKTEVFLALGARVVAFEPQEDCLQELHARLGNRSSLVTVPAAVGRQPGSVTFHVSPTRTESSCNQYLLGVTEKSIQVPMTTLDEAIYAYGAPAFCKIDVQGLEQEVLRGLSSPIPLVAFEYWMRDNGVARVVECLDLLSRFGEIRVNLTAAETPGFLAPRWMSRGDFLEFFQNYINILWYGDILVRT